MSTLKRDNCRTLHFLGIEWINEHGEHVFQVSNISIVQGIMSLLQNCTTRAQFVSCLIKGGGANLSDSSRHEFSKMVYLIYCCY